MASPHMRTVIVVGVDGSPSSREALRWALRYARSTGAEIRAVMAWDLPTTYGYAPSYEDFDWAEAAREALEKTVEQTMDPDSSVKLSTELVPGHAGNALVGASQDADLLVVGSRGHSAVAEMLLGSVSHHCVQHAACPVVVVRAH